MLQPSQHLVITNDMASFQTSMKTDQSGTKKQAKQGSKPRPLVYYRHWYFITVFSIKSSSNGTQKPITYAMMSNYLFKI